MTAITFGVTEGNHFQGAAYRSDARKFAVCSTFLIITLVLAKAIAAYSGGAIFVYMLPLLAGILLLGYCGTRDWLLPAATAVACLSLIAAIANFVPDSTWDGNGYHKPAIVALHDGWNPWVFPEFGDWVKTRNETYFSAAVWQNNSNSTWVSHYPNLSWLFGAALMDYGYGWESGKALSWFLSVVLFVYARVVVSQYVLNRILSNLIAALIVLCAPSLVQLPTNYVDGTTYLSAALVIICLLDRDRTRYINTIIWSCLIILAGLKFTGALYAAILALPFLALRRPRVKEVCAWSLIGAFTLSHPYINHVVSGLDITYPITSSDVVLRGQVEQTMLDKPPLSAMGESLFSSTSNNQQRPGLKFPGVVHNGEIAASGSPDTRYAGFGPWFSLGLLISSFGVLFVLARGLRERKFARPEIMLLASIGLLLLLTMIHAAPWWARYVPFFYLIPILGLMLVFHSPTKITRILGFSGLFVLAINAAMVIKGSTDYVRGYSMHLGVVADRDFARNFQRTDTIIVRAPEFVAFSALYHFKVSLGYPDVVYQSTTLDALTCPNSQDLGLWINLVRVCQRPQAQQ